MRYVVDIDATICTPRPGNYKAAEPFKERIEKLNQLYNQGHTIIFFTARGMTRFEGNVSKCYTEYYELTKQQLDSWGCLYHQLIMGKPDGDLFIDDRALNDKTFFGDQ